MQRNYFESTILPTAGGPFGKGGIVNGFVARGWEEVREAFEENFALNMELGAQLVIYQHNNVVVDLCGRASKQKVYGVDTVQMMYSSGKNMEAIVMAILVDRELISYDDLVIVHWPEFGGGNKGDVTIADVLRHEAGVPFFSDPKDILNSWKDTKLTCKCLEEIEPMERAIEGAAKWHHLGRRHYHACTRGWILSGIVRRVDPQRRTLAQFMREEICTPLGLKIYCGVSPEEQTRLHFADMKNMPLNGAGTVMKALAGGMVDKILPRPSSPAPASSPASPPPSGETSSSVSVEPPPPPPSPASVRGTGDPSTIRGVVKTFTAKHNPILRHNVAEWLIKDTRWANSVAGRAQEFPSANMHANARSVALVNTLFCNGGKVGDVQLISPRTVSLAFSEPKLERDEFLNATYSFTKGGFSRMEDMDTVVVPEDFRRIYDGFWGWGGLGGSWSLWDPHREISFAYMMNAKTLQNIGGPKGDRIMRAVQNVLARDKREVTTSLKKGRKEIGLQCGGDISTES